MKWEDSSPRNSTTGNLPWGEGSELPGGQGERENGKEGKSCGPQIEGGLSAPLSPDPSMIFQCVWVHWSLSHSTTGSSKVTSVLKSCASEHAFGEMARSVKALALQA